jgi:hypothetical protein
MHPSGKSSNAGTAKSFKPRKARPADVAWHAYFCSHWPTGQTQF